MSDDTNPNTEEAAPVEAAEPVETSTTETPDAPAELSPFDAFKKGVEEVSEAATPKEAEKPAEAASPEKPVDPAEKEKADIKAKDDEEIKALGLRTQKSADRFRALSADSRELQSLKKDLPVLQDKAQRQDRMMEIIDDTKANPQQIGNAFKYLKAINSGDPEQLRSAAKMMADEVKQLYAALGEELPGISPLETHKDLQDEVEQGTLTRERALEIARSRGTQTLNNKRTEQQNNEQRQKVEFEAATNQAFHDINQLETQWRKTDPHAAYRIDALAPTVMAIKESLHPSKWSQALQIAYSKIPNPAPKPAATPSPVRPNAQTTMAHAPKDGFEAFTRGVDLFKSGAATDY